MEAITSNDLQELISVATGPCVSIFMPTHPAGREGQQDVVRLKNLVNSAEQQLIERGMRAPTARDLLAPILRLPSDGTTWLERKQSLAIFRSAEAFIYYRLDAQLQEAALVGPRFFVKPLLPAITNCPRFFILSVSRNRPRVLKATWTNVESLRPVGFPDNFDATLNLESADRGEQVHSATNVPLGKESGVFHGQGGYRDTLKAGITSYCQRMDTALRPVLRAHSWPLVLAGVEYELAIYRRVSEYDRIVDEMLLGNFDHTEDHALCAKALPIVQRHYDAARREKLARYQSIAGTKLASDQVDEVVIAAHEGRVDTLFADPRASLFGRYSAEMHGIELLETVTDPAHDLVEQAILETLRRNGSVYDAAPQDGSPTPPLRAIFRY
jgi:hypothetical protein